jgi:hypothetical protein
VWVEGNVGFEPFTILVVCEEHDACDRFRASNEEGGVQFQGLGLPQTVTATPVMFRGVNSSPNSKADTLMVATSFAIPAIDMGTAPTRWMILDRHDDGSEWSEGDKWE